MEIKFPFEYFQFEGRKYCEHDFHVLFAPCCGKCRKIKNFLDNVGWYVIESILIKNSLFCGKNENQIHV